MPFLARKNNTTVIPESVPDGVSVECPSCGDEMRARGPFSDGRARHFFHVSPTDDGAGCTGGGGESDPHRKMKSMAVSGLRHLFDSYRRCEPEVTLNVPQTPTDPDVRRADALVEFDETDIVYGKGVIVEVQYRNKTKNIRATTHDYLSLGYSVFWATEDDFTDDRFLTDILTTAFDNQDEPTAFAPSFSTPPPVSLRMLTSEQDRDTDDPWTPVDPRPECQHEIIPREEGGRICIRCGLQAQRRYYDEYRNQYRHPSSYTFTPDKSTEFVYDRTTLSNAPQERAFTEEGQTTHLHEWRPLHKAFGGTKYRCTLCRAIMIVSRDKVHIDHNPGDAEETDGWRDTITTKTGGEGCDHNWEEQGITRVCTECGKELKPWDT